MAVMLCGAVAASARGQEPPSDFPRYCEALRQHAAGRFEVAMVMLEAWPAASLRRAAALTARCTGAATPARGALLITDLAIHINSTSASQVAQYLGAAEAAVHLVRPDDLRDRTPPAIARFQADWWAVAGQLMLAWTNPDQAARFIERGLHDFNDSSALHTLAGVQMEMRMHLRDANLHDRVMVDEAPRSNRRAQFLAAENEFRRAIALDPRAFGARVHLGRVLYLTRHSKEAREILMTVTASDAAPASWRTLAHLFLGAVAEYEYDTNEARHEYEAALALRRSQTAYIALSFVERATGHEARARELLADWAEVPPDSGLDPFAGYQNGSFDLDLIDALRAQVER
jgi:Tetratricopeptide repeat